MKTNPIDKLVDVSIDKQKESPNNNDMSADKDTPIDKLN
jgi:hypothetical protein